MANFPRTHIIGIVRNGTEGKICSTEVFRLVFQFEIRMRNT